MIGQSLSWSRWYLWNFEMTNDRRKYGHWSRMGALESAPGSNPGSTIYLLCDPVSQILILLSEQSSEGNSSLMWSLFKSKHNSYKDLVCKLAHSQYLKLTDASWYKNYHKSSFRLWGTFVEMTTVFTNNCCFPIKESWPGRPRKYSPYVLKENVTVL